MSIPKFKEDHHCKLSKSIIKKAVEMSKILDKFWYSPDCGYGRDLTGACAIGAYHLHKQIKGSTLVRGEFTQDGYTDDHCWVEVDDYIIDPTASQFGYEIPRITKSKKKYKKLKKNKVAEKDLSTWGEEQNPFHYEIVDGRLKRKK